MNRLCKKTWNKLGDITQWAVTFMTVNVLWILFRAENLSFAGAFLKRLFSLSDFSISDQLYECFNLVELLLIEGRIPYVKQVAGFNMCLFFMGVFFIVLNLHNSREIEFRPTMRRSIVTVIFLGWSVISFTGMSTFLYFNF